MLRPPSAKPFSFNKIEIKLKEDHNPKFEYILPLDLIIGERKINFFCIWAMPHKTERAKDYVGQIWGAVNYYGKQLDEDSIWIGDFNSNAIWDKKKRVGNHSDVVELLKQKEVVQPHIPCLKQFVHLLTSLD